MRFFRQHRGSAWLAIFALSAQLALSFGHVHLHATKHGINAASLGACGIKTGSPCPAQRGDDALCAICWTISIAGAGVVPPPILIGLPLLEANLVVPPLSVTALRGSKIIQTRARAPPLV